MENASVPNEFEDFRLVAFAGLHAFLHGRDDGLRLVLGAVFGTLLGRSCNGVINEHSE